MLWTWHPHFNTCVLYEISSNQLRIKLERDNILACIWHFALVWCCVVSNAFVFVRMCWHKQPICNTRLLVRVNLFLYLYSFSPFLVLRVITVVFFLFVCICTNTRYATNASLCVSISSSICTIFLTFHEQREPQDTPQKN